MATAATFGLLNRLAVCAGIAVRTCRRRARSDPPSSTEPDILVAVDQRRDPSPSTSPRPSQQVSIEQHFHVTLLIFGWLTGNLYRRLRRCGSSAKRRIAATLIAASCALLASKRCLAPMKLT